MPELPDVEVFRQLLEDSILRRKIQKVHVESAKELKTPIKEFERTLEGRQFTSTERRGKYLFARLSKDGAVMFHFGMTGRFEAFTQKDAVPDHARIVLDFSRKMRFAYVCQRRFGEVELIDDVESYCKKRKVGPDAMLLGKNDFISLLSERKGMVKSVLMNQEIISGLGNVYTDEILFQCGIHPKAKIEKLGKKGIRSIYTTMQRVIDRAIRAGGDPFRLPKSYLTPNRKDGVSSPRGKGTVKKISVGGRNGYYVPQRQKEG